MSKDKHEKPKKNKKIKDPVLRARQELRDQILGPGHGEEMHAMAVAKLIGAEVDDPEEFMAWIHRIEADNHYISHQHPLVQMMSFSAAFFNYIEEIDTYTASVSQLMATTPGHAPLINSECTHVKMAIVDLQRKRTFEFIFDIADAVPYSPENIQAVGLQVEGDYEPEEDEAWMMAEAESPRTGHSARCILRCARLATMIRPAIVN